MRIKRLNFILGLLFFIISQSMMAGIVYDLEDPSSSIFFKQAVDNANSSLNRQSVTSMGSAPAQICTIKTAPEVIVPTQPGVKPTTQDITKSPEASFSVNSLNIDTFKIVEEKMYSCQDSERVSLKGANGNVIKNVCPEMINQIVLHGIARLEDGRVIQISKAEKVKRIVNGVESYFWEKRFALANPKCAFGQTSAGVCLEPYRSVIVSSHTGLKVGDVIFLEKFKDVIVPPGIKHGGYFIVAATKKSDQSLRPELSLFLGPDSASEESMRQLALSNNLGPAPLRALTDESLDKAVGLILSSRKSIKNAMLVPVAPTTTRTPSKPPRRGLGGTSPGSISSSPAPDRQPSSTSTEAKPENGQTEESDLSEIITQLDSYFPQGGDLYNMNSLGPGGEEKLCNTINTIVDGKAHPPAHITHCTIAGFVGMMKVMQLSYPEKWSRVKENFRCTASPFTKGHPYQVLNDGNERGLEAIFSRYELGSFYTISADDIDSNPPPKPGDPVLIDRNSSAKPPRSGHMTIFSHYNRDSEGKVVEVCYWSSNGSRNKHEHGSGYGQRCESVSVIAKLNVGSFE